jgi:RNA polymerase sigma factor for flagellar operon FliA
MHAPSVTKDRLTPSQAEALWRAWSTKKDASARDRLVLAYSPMVKYLAAKKVRELPAHCELDDLVSCGLIALIEAVERFDPRKGASFEQYAWTRVAGAVVDELRRQDWASRSVRRMGRKIEHARDGFYAREGTMPDDQELAAALQLTVEELRGGIEEIERADLMSLNAPTRSAEDATLEIGDTIEAPFGEHNPERASLAAERMAIVREAISELSEREQRVLALIHVHELQGAEVGRMLGVSESRVSQILAGVRSNLRAKLAGYDHAPVAAA